MGDSDRVVMTPLLDHIGIFAEFRQLVQGRGEFGPLCPYQWRRVIVRAFMQPHLDQKLDSQVADVGNWGGHPGVGGLLSVGGDPVLRSARSGCSRLGQVGFGESRGYNSVESAIDEWSSNRDYSSKVARWFEMACQGESMRWLFGQKAQNGPLVQRQCRFHEVMLVSMRLLSVIDAD